MRSRLVVSLVVQAAVAAAGALPACGTVGLGSPPAGGNACPPSEKFFVEKIWPEFLERDYGGKHCYDGGCHGTGSARLMILGPPSSSPTLPLAPEWMAVYQAVSEQMLCMSASASPLLERPSNVN